MVKSTITYQSPLRTQATHEPSGTQIITDAPLDNHGRGESFSPTDLVATAVGSCMATIMGIIAERQNINLEGMRVETVKHMSTESPRRIAQIDVDLHMPINQDHPDAQRLVAGAKGCPVHHSIHPDIIVNLNWHWNQ